MNLWKPFKKYLMDVESRMRDSILLIAVRRGMTGMIPLLLAGSFATIVAQLPIPAYQQALNSEFGKMWLEALRFIRGGTFDILSLLITVFVSYSYVSEYRDRHNSPVSPIIVSMVAVTAFFGMSGIYQTGSDLSRLGSTNVFQALVASLLTSYLYVQISRQKWFKIRSFSSGSDTAYQTAVAAVIPAAMVLLLFDFVGMALTACGVRDIYALTNSAFVHIFDNVGDGLFRSLLYTFVVHSLWFFGIHGSYALYPVYHAVMSPEMVSNQALLAAGQPATHLFVSTFFTSYVFVGGCGSTLCLLLAIFVTGRYTTTKRLARMAILPVIFNVNELVIFGAPIVLNFIYVIPFICVPLMMTFSTWVAMSMGWVAAPGSNVNWTIPVLLSGWLASGSWSGVLLQGINLVLGVLIYIPFVKIAEASGFEQLRLDLDRLLNLLKESESQGENIPLITRQDSVGNISRFLAGELGREIAAGGLRLYHQPQVDSRGAVVGSEALLRWNHESYGWIYPPLIIKLAEESGLMLELGAWILQQACQDLKRVEDEGHLGLTVSVNISSTEVQSAGFVEAVQKAVIENQIQPQQLILEMTERVALSNSPRVEGNLATLAAYGAKISMDDFGMGHSSLLYLKEHRFDEVKLDGALVREMKQNVNCRSIIRSIVELGKDLNYVVTAEYVEDAHQREILEALGCHQYQGYLYSPAITLEQFLQYLKVQNGKGEI